MSAPIRWAGMVAMLLVGLTGMAEVAHATKVVPKILELEEAIDLAHKALGTTKEHYFYEPLPKYENPPFFVMQGCSVEHDGCFGWVAINAWTGDAWDAWLCKHIPSRPALKKEQARIRAMFSPRELKQYAKLRRIRPPCFGP